MSATFLTSCHFREKENTNMMKITISRVEDHTKETIAVMSDSYYVAMFMDTLIKEAYESGKTQFVVDVDFEEKKA